MFYCKVCNNHVGTGSHNLKLANNVYSHQNCCSQTLKEFGVDFNNLTYLHPINISIYDREAINIFPYIFEGIKEILLTSSFNPNSYEDFNLEAYNILLKFIKLQEFCIEHSIEFKEKIYKFYAYNLINSVISDEENNRLISLIDYYAYMSGAQISPRRAVNYRPSSETIYIYAK